MTEIKENTANLGMRTLHDFVKGIVREVQASETKSCWMDNLTDILSKIMTPKLTKDARNGLQIKQKHFFINHVHCYEYRFCIFAYGSCPLL